MDMKSYKKLGIEQKLKELGLSDYHYHIDVKD